MKSGMAMLKLNEALLITFTMKKIITNFIHSVTENRKKPRYFISEDTQRRKKHFKFGEDDFRN